MSLSTGASVPGANAQIGEAFVGRGANAAHVNTVLGLRSGPVGAAFATIIGSPSAGHVPFLVVARPNVPVQPPTLFVNKAPLQGEAHELLTWGAAQAGVAAGVTLALKDGTVPVHLAKTLVVIAAVWVDPGASEEEEVYANNREATCTSLQRGKAGLPSMEQVMDAGEFPENPFFRRR